MSAGQESRSLHRSADDLATPTRTFRVPNEPFAGALPDLHDQLLATFQLKENLLSDTQYQELTELVDTVSRDARLRDLIAQELDKDAPSAAGYLILDFSDVVSDELTLRDYIILTAACTIFGRPFGAFGRFGLWKPVDVDPAVDPWRAGGAGLNPLHIDFVNTTLPPDYTCFFCVREDPLGGGDSVISNHLRAFSMLTAEQRELALKPAIYEGKFFNLVGVGSEYRPFPLFEYENDGSITCRFTAKSLYVEDKTDKAVVALIREINGLLDRNSAVFHLRQKQLLIVDQKIACHGRLPLGAGQAEISPECRRLLMQIFMKRHPAPAALTVGREGRRAPM